jgi:ribose-phosphate pyrophosphokinase
VCHKQRSGPSTVSVNRITGDVAGHHCVIVDDMITTGSTIVESVRALREAGAVEDIVVAATHGVLASGAVAKLAVAGVREVLVTNSIPVTAMVTKRVSIDVVSVAPLLATAIKHLLDGGSIRDLA